MSNKEADWGGLFFEVSLVVLLNNTSLNESDFFCMCRFRTVKTIEIRGIPLMLSPASTSVDGFLILYARVNY